MQRKLSTIQTNPLPSPLLNLHYGNQILIVENTWKIYKKVSKEKKALCSIPAKETYKRTGMGSNHHKKI